MIKLVDILLENLSNAQLVSVEKYADKLFSAVGVDVEFTRHFLDRVNDARNGKPISEPELIGLFKRTYKKHGKKISKMDASTEAVIVDMNSDINMPFVMQYDKSNGELDFVSKTIMRKKSFATSNRKFEV